MNFMGLLFLVGVSGVQTPVLLGTAANYVILAKTGITTTTSTVILGNMGVSPIASTAITGFNLVMDSTGTFSTSGLVTGQIYAPNYQSPTATQLTAAIGDMEIAYTNAAGRSDPNTTELGAGFIGGMTLPAGLHKWGGAVNIQSDVTFSGSSTDVWVLQIAGGLIVATSKKIILSGGASANNIFWQVAGETTLEAGSVLNGIVLCKVNIAMKAGATLIGRALVQTTVTLISNSVKPPPSSPAICGAISLASTPSSIRVGAKLQLTATGVDQYGVGCIFKYLSSKTRVLTVSLSGLVTGVSAGSASITVSSGLQKKVVSLSVVN